MENIAQNGSRQKVISDSPNRPSGSSKNCDDNNKQKHLEMDSRKRHSSSSQLPNGITSKPHTEHPQTANHNSGDHQQNNHSSSRTSTPSSSMETDSPSTSTRKKKSTDINNSRQHLKDSTSKNERKCYCSQFNSVLDALVYRLFIPENLLCGNTTISIVDGV